MDNINIGIEYGVRERIANNLKKLLADSYTLYLQSHNFHWNVTGSKFRDLHLMFEEHYTELAVAVDEVAERIRALGFAAPGTYLALSELSSIEEVEGVPCADDMLAILKRSHETIVQTCRSALKNAQDADDESSCALISDRMRIHEKTAWMLRSLQD